MVSLSLIDNEELSSHKTDLQGANRKVTIGRACSMIWLQKSEHVGEDRTTGEELVLRDNKQEEDLTCG